MLFFANISWFRCQKLFLTSDSESTQNFGSYRTFLGIYTYFHWVLEILFRFRWKTGFCCSLWIRPLSDRTEGTIEKSLFQSTYHESLVLFFLIQNAPHPFGIVTSDKFKKYRRSHPKPGGEPCTKDKMWQHHGLKNDNFSARIARERRRRERKILGTNTSDKFKSTPERTQTEEPCRKAKTRPKSLTKKGTFSARMTTKMNSSSRVPKARAQNFRYWYVSQAQKYPRSHPQTGDPCLKAKCGKITNWKMTLFRRASRPKWTLARERRRREQET